MENKKFIHQLILAKNDSKIMLEILEQFKPLIEAYTKKLFFLEKDDARQEITVAVIEAIKSISLFENDAQCITYIHNSVKFRFSYLCKKNLKLPEFKDINEYESNSIPYIENYSDVETAYDIENRKKQLPKKQQLIFDYLIRGYSDKEISNILGLSRLYINRVKKKFI